MAILTPTIILCVMGAVFGIGLAVAAKAFAVQKDERVGFVREALPGANCAACGYTGCDGYAEAVVSGEAAPNLCVVGGPGTAARIGEVMGVDAGAVARRAARVRCGGTNETCKVKYVYDGVQECAAAKLVHDGPSACAFSCVGFGDCVKVCEYGAIFVEDGLAYVAESRCVACGKCVAACPKGLIDLVPVTSNYTVRCHNNDRGVNARKNCQVSCIGCMLCVKACKFGAVLVKDNLARIDAAACTNCGECMKACPQKCISFYDTAGLAGEPVAV
jgi:Na+-translocating ferredoxin:NAD+ oxidoreductase RNF subunit RnfB